MLVANPRKLHAISRHERKRDRRDAQMLARLARVDPALLHPIQHGPAQAQHDLLGLKLRDALVRTRVTLINTVRFTLKSLGHAVHNPSSESFHQTILADVPAECLPVIQPVLTVLAQLTTEIKGLERDLVQRSKKDYPVTQPTNRSPAHGPAHRAGLRPQDRRPATLWPQPRRRRVSGFVPAPRPERRHGQATAHQQMRRRPVAPAAGQRRPLHSGPVRSPTAPCANTASA